MQFDLVLFDTAPGSSRERDLRNLLQAMQQRGHAGRVLTNYRPEKPFATEHLLAGAFGWRRAAREKKFLQAISRLRENKAVAFSPMAESLAYWANDADINSVSAADMLQAQALPALLLRGQMLDRWKVWHPSAERAAYILDSGCSARQRQTGSNRAARAGWRESFGLGEGEFTLLLVTDMLSDTGAGRALAALAHMVQEQPVQTVRLLVVTPSADSRFRAHARRLKVADLVEFVPPGSDLRGPLLAADVLLHPAERAVHAPVILEAVAAGLPVITTLQVDCAQHVLASAAGIVLPEPFSQEQLNKALLRMLDGVKRADCRESGVRYMNNTLSGDPYLAAVELLEVLSKER